MVKETPGATLAELVEPFGVYPSTIDCCLKDLELPVKNTLYAERDERTRYCYLIIFICFIFLQKRSFYVSIMPFPNFQVTIQRYN